MLHVSGMAVGELRIVVGRDTASGASVQRSVTVRGDAEPSVSLDGSAHLELHAVGIAEEQRPGRAEALDHADIRVGWR